MNDRQSWLLIYLLSRHPIGISVTHKVPYSCTLNGKNYGCPGGIGMHNIRGLERRGYITETRPGLFYLTENGVLEAQKQAESDQWI